GPTKAPSAMHRYSAAGPSFLTPGGRSILNVSPSSSVRRTRRNALTYPTLSPIVRATQSIQSLNVAVILRRFTIVLPQCCAARIVLPDAHPRRFARTTRDKAHRGRRRE